MAFAAIMAAVMIAGLAVGDHQMKENQCLKLTSKPCVVPTPYPQDEPIKEGGGG